MKSVPPRGSGWGRSLSLTTHFELRTHPLPRGGTDFIQVRLKKIIIKTRSYSFAMQSRRRERSQIRKKLCAGVRVRLILTWLSHEIGLIHIHCWGEPLSYFLALILILSTGSTSWFQNNETCEEISQFQTESTLCLLDVTAFPVAVRFRGSIALTQAIKQAGVERESIKNRVVILRRVQSGMLNAITLDLKAIEKGKAVDFDLGPHDMVFVLSKRKQQLVSEEVRWSGCKVCGCRPMHGMHGPFIVPKPWNESDAPDERNLDPNN
jgi:hypothetical protein